MSKLIVHLFTILILLSCNSSIKKKRYAYETKVVSGSTNNKIEVLDFGGKGKPMLFLAGLGNSAHVYVDFAPDFCDKFHVYAVTRRGSGISEHPPAGYHIDTLAMDILAVTKALNMEKIILIGHSIAGDEVSKFASSFPDKVEKVIYLDAAEDHAELNTRIFPYMPALKPTEKDSSSFENWKTYLKNTIGVTMPEEEIRNIFLFSKEGKFLKDLTSGSIQELIFRGLKRPDYKNINCPALAIFAIADSKFTIFPFYNSLDTVSKKKADSCFTLFRNFSRNQQKIFIAKAKKGIVKEIKGANHYLFISNPKETENLIRQFLR